MNPAYENRLLPPALFLLTGLLVGVAVAKSLTFAAALAILVLGLCAVTAPPAYWAMAAVGAAVIGPGLSSAGLAPSFVAYLHFPIAAAAFLIAAVQYRGGSRLANYSLGALGLLALGCALSALFAGDGPVRALFSFALLAEPVALLAAIACVPPGREEFAFLKKGLLFIVLIQIPVAYLQVATVGLGSLFQEGASYADKVTGTFGKLGGANTVSAIGVVGGIWVLAMPRRTSWRIPVAVALLALPFFARTYKVLLALPAILVASPRGSGLKGPVRIGVVVVSIAALLLFPGLLPRYVAPSLSGGLSSESGKTQAFSVAWAGVTGSVSNFAFGSGPAETVSGAAFLSTDPLVKPSSPIRYLGITPSQTAIELGALEETDKSSFLQAKSSAFGVLGDLGVFGLAVYVGFFAWVFLQLYRTRSPEAVAASAGVLLLAILGVITEGWEVPSLTLFVAFMIGLALIPAPGRPSVKLSELEASG